MAQAVTMQNYVDHMLEQGKVARIRMYAGGAICDVVHSIDPKSGLAVAEEKVLA